MKLFNKAALEKYVSGLMGGDATIKAIIPQLETVFAFIVENDLVNNGKPLNGAVRMAMSGDDYWDYMIPTEYGNGFLINIKEFMDHTWPIWGISPNEKVVLYAPKKEIRVLSMEEFGKYLCQESGVRTVAYSYPENPHVMFEGTMQTSTPTSSLGQILQAIIDEALDKSDLTNASKNLLGKYKEEANAEIWGKNDYFILSSGDILVLPEKFGILMEHADILCDQIIQRAQDTDLEDVIVSTVENIKEVLSRHDLEAMTEIEESVQILQEVVPDAETLEALNTLGSMF